MSAAVLLFDIDGTLLDAAGGGRRALQAAFRQVYGSPDALDRVDLRGMTDAQITRSLLNPGKCQSAWDSH